MHRNFYLFEQQVIFLRSRIIGLTIADIFTHRKDELVLRIENDRPYFLRIGIGKQTPYILLNPAQNIKEPKIDFFNEIVGQKINSISIASLDKIIRMNAGKYTIQCFFYGPTMNVSLIGENSQVVSSFKKLKKDGPQSDITQGDHVIHPDELKKYGKKKDKRTASEFMKRMVVGFNQLLATEVCHRCHIEPELIISNMTIAQWQNFIDVIIRIQNEIREGRAFLYDNPKRNLLLSLIKLTHTDKQYLINEFPNPNDAWIEYIYQNLQKATTERIIHRARQKVSGRINYLEKTIKKFSDFQELDDKRKLSELKGHLLQTYASDILSGETEANLKNILSENRETIKIKLDPKISIHQNAARYFEKYKNIDVKKEELQIKRDTFNRELIYWKKLYNDIDSITTLKKAERLNNLLIDKKLVQHDKTETKKKTIDRFSFNRLLLDQHWEILIGKNAENNDILTFKFAHKHDIWLHAQGVSGSHVVIHLQDKSHLPPKGIVEQAASIAAYFSAAKGSKLVPVIYTEVRYVRKPRKSKHGTVSVSNAKTIFVEPKKYL